MFRLVVRFTARRRSECFDGGPLDRQPGQHDRLERRRSARYGCGQQRRKRCAGLLGAAGGGFDLAHPLSFSTGSDPVDVEVANINGDSKQDVIVTNYGSNDVSILLGTGDSTIDATTGKSNLLKAGVRLNVRQGPVSTQIVLQPGRTNPDLLVTNSISNSVYLLPGLGGGFFNDVTPTQFETGNTPVQTVVGEFQRANGLRDPELRFELTHVLFQFSGGGGPRNFSGGTSPFTAVSFGLNGDGTTDLIVGNNGNGVFSVFEGDQAGLSLVNSFSGDALEHPAALAIMGQGQDLQLLALDEGDESVHVFDRSSVTGPGQQTLIPGQSELAGFATGVLGTNTSGISIVFSLISALGISIEGFLEQSSRPMLAAMADRIIPSRPTFSRTWVPRSTVVIDWSTRPWKASAACWACTWTTGRLARRSGTSLRGRRMHGCSNLE